MTPPIHPLSTLASLVLPALLMLATPAVAQVSAATPFEDTMAQRMLACTACHGEQGRAGPDGYYPRIAGKPAGYLYNQLLNFRDGQRHYRLMGQLMEPLSDSYLWEMAEHFAGLDLPHPAPAPLSASPAQRARGEQLALRGDAARGLPSCAACHGDALTGREPHVPGLLGLPRDYLNAQLGAWRTGLRRAHAPDCMAPIARQMGDEDVAAVTGWLASQPVPPDARQRARAQAVTAQAPLPASLACGSAVPPAATGGRP